jgi:hypothetical protein
LNARDAELAQFAPYSLRFTGYPITRGRLTADVRYQVEDGQLNASNHIIIDDFTLGDRVESPDAIDIPLKLGVSLLKDREGRIRLDVPLTGSLSDPKFRVGPILWQVVQNIIVKAVTAPFTMLGSLFGSKEELEFVEFEPGSAEISASQTNRLAVLSKGLVERPQLQLEILPGFDPVEDRRGLAAAALDRQLRDLRLEEYARQGTATINVQLSPEDRARLIPVAYAKRFGNAPARVETPAAASPEIPSTSDPSDPAAQEQAASEGVSVEQMERRLIDTARVQPEELLDLAARRAAAVQAHLLQAIPSAEERIALAPDGAKNPGEGKSRVTFRLK